MLGLAFSSKLDCGSYIITIAKTALETIGVLIRSMKFLSMMLLSDSKTLPYDRVLNTVVISGLVLLAATWRLDELQKQIFRAAVPSLAVSFEPLAYCRNVGSLCLFYRYYFGRCSSELAQLVPLPYSRGRFTLYFDRLHYFSVTISRCYKDVYVNSFFPHTARLWNSLPIECFPLTYDITGFKSRINRHLLTLGSF